MKKGTLAFYIFIIVITVKTLLFIFLYVIVMKKFNELVKIHEKYTKPIERR